jgi:hypothetical protein
MSEPGYIAVHRSIWGHDLFADAVFGEREAWLWLVSSAAWKDCKVRCGNTMIDIKRGQLLFATRFLAKKWKWSHTSTVRFLNLLKNETMIGTQSTRQSTLITICNYDKYQISGNVDGTQSGTQTGTEAVHKRYKEEELNNLINRKDTCAVAKATRPKRDYSKEFEEAWQAYPRREGGNPKHPAAKLFLAAVKAGEEPQAIIDGAKRFAIAESRNVGTTYIPQMVKWLRDRRWLDYGATAEVLKFDVRRHLV